MAHPNILERQAHVKDLLKTGIKIDSALKKELCNLYSCSPSAIVADVVYFTRPKTTETPFQSNAMRKKIFSRDGRICQYCGDISAYEYIVEHIIPAALGGIARPHNLVIACQKCNAKKRRQVWIPKNLDPITASNLEWRKRVLKLAENKTSISNKIA